MEQYLIDIKRFPAIPDEVKDETIKFLKQQVVVLPLNSRRNFFYYLFSESEDVFNRFLDYYLLENFEDLEEVMPFC